MHCTYSHIDLDERRKIARWRMTNISVEVIAEKLGRHRSTIFRELKRNQFNDDEITDINWSLIRTGLVYISICHSTSACRRD